MNKKLLLSSFLVLLLSLTEAHSSAASFSKEYEKHMTHLKEAETTQQMRERATVLLDYCQSQLAKLKKVPLSKLKSSTSEKKSSQTSGSIEPVNRLISRSQECKKQVDRLENR